MNSSTLGGLAGLILLVLVVIGVWWSNEPDQFTVQPGPQAEVIGTATTKALISATETLLDKPGGYLTNDLMPPGIWLDNIPNWEYGVLVQARDMVRALRNDMSRSQSQSLEDKDLAEADPLLSFDNNSWIFPATEKEYRRGIEHLQSYLDRLSEESQQDAQFYARADNLAAWLAIVEKRLGGLSQRLSASVGQIRVNTDLAGDPSAAQSTPRPGTIEVKTPWFEIDDVFYEARGAAWALSHFLKAAEIDFHEVLTKKQAHVSVKQIIRELDATQQTLWSPMVLNGGGFGLFANHSLVMASYLSRAHAGVIDLRELLQDG